jgi:hypothetical protein
MNGSQLKRMPVTIGAAGAATALFALTEYVWGSGGSMLFTLTFWISLIEGSVALVAAGEICNSKWTEPVKRHLLSVYPLILVIALLFLLFAIRIDIYPWDDKPNGWLNRNFFIGRNVMLMLLTFAAARSFAASSIAGSANKKTRAVLYLFAYAVSQSMIAFDWVMSLEYPWFSSLFGIYFGIESLYAGIALSVLYIIGRSGAVPRKTLQDAATVLFGFSLFWAGLFYAQFLVIWYGNLPEEAGFVFRRVYEPPYSLLAKSVLAMLFVFPFIILASRKTKRIAAVVAAVALMILAGIIIEKIILIHPAVPIPLLPAALEFLFLGAAFAAAVRGRQTDD